MISVSKDSNRKKKIWTKSEGKRWTIHRVPNISWVGENCYERLSDIDPDFHVGFVDPETRQGYVSEESGTEQDIERVTFHEWLHCQFPDMHEMTVRKLERHLHAELYSRGLRFWK